MYNRYHLTQRLMCHLKNKSMYRFLLFWYLTFAGGYKLEMQLLLVALIIVLETFFYYLIVQLLRSYKNIRFLVFFSCFP